MQNTHRHLRTAVVAGFWLLSTTLIGPVAAQEHGTAETGEHAIEAEAEGGAHEHGEERAHHGHHPNEIAFFVGATDEKGHDLELTFGW